MLKISNKKKIWLFLGSLVSLITPISFIISCGGSTMNNDINKLEDGQQPNGVSNMDGSFNPNIDRTSDTTNEAKTSKFIDQIMINSIENFKMSGQDVLSKIVNSKEYGILDITRLKDVLIQDNPQDDILDFSDSSTYLENNLKYFYGQILKSSTPIETFDVSKTDFLSNDGLKNVKNISSKINDLIHDNPTKKYAIDYNVISEDQQVDDKFTTGKYKINVYMLKETSDFENNAEQKQAYRSFALMKDLFLNKNKFDVATDLLKRTTGFYLNSVITRRPGFSDPMKSFYGSVLVVKNESMHTEVKGMSNGEFVSYNWGNLVSDPGNSLLATSHFGPKIHTIFDEQNPPIGDSNNRTTIADDLFNKINNMDEEYVNQYVTPGLSSSANWEYSKWVLAKENTFTRTVLEHNVKTGNLQLTVSMTVIPRGIFGKSDRSLNVNQDGITVGDKPVLKNFWTENFSIELPKMTTFNNDEALNKDAFKSLLKDNFNTSFLVENLQKLFSSFNLLDTFKRFEAKKIILELLNNIPNVSRIYEKMQWEDMLDKFISYVEAHPIEGFDLSTMSSIFQKAKTNHFTFALIQSEAIKSRQIPAYMYSFLYYMNRFYTEIVNWAKNQDEYKPLFETELKVDDVLNMSRKQTYINQNNFFLHKHETEEGIILWNDFDHSWNFQAIQTFIVKNRFIHDNLKYIPQSWLVKIATQTFEQIKLIVEYNKLKEQHSTEFAAAMITLKISPTDEDSFYNQILEEVQKHL